VRRTNDNTSEPHDINIKSLSFTWTEPQADEAQPHSSDFQITVEDRIHIKRGDVVTVIGSTGSGKTSLLLA
jgi:ABC-type methionine transport system ATPase subunit